ncbi:hypothetical protein [Prevotella sp. E2-28]|uniref:hypothetical protein n=1 Tax=Prevotella sp. E2-28 TaxID=2913620 RepID=UPI001EDA7A46|nr:hypothetical protein [Prevotella sp. E2-28]UKK52665.1 hypothetical protein L6465_08605 [Prevotella sp. E2-28]
MKTKKQLKDVFSGLSALWYQATELDLSDLTKALAISPDYDLPVKVDSINLEQGDPTIDHYKVIGLPGDWVTSSEAGDIELSFRIPTKHTDVLEMAYGEGAVKKGLNVTVGEDAYTGTGLVLQQKKIDGTFIFVNENKTKLLVLTNVTLWAKPVLDQDAKGVFALDFNGSIESDGVNPDILFLEKGSAEGSGSGEANA